MIRKEAALVSMPKFCIFTEKNMECFQNLNREIIPVKGKYAIHGDLETMHSPKFST